MRLFLQSVILFFIVITTGIFAQETSIKNLSDNEFLIWLKQFRANTITPQIQSYQEVQKNKCGMWIAGEIIRRRASMTTVQQEELRKILRPQIMDTSITSPLGSFVIHFNLSGPDEPALLTADGQRRPGTAVTFAKEAAKYFDYSKQIEIDSLGYATPPFQKGEQAYQVYIKALSPGFYGATYPTEIFTGPQTAQRATSYIEIDNDFLGLYTTGLNGLKVTAAHEFHHVIQLGSYGYWDYNSEGFFYELTSTYFEDYVFNDVNDYYYYLNSVGSIFDRPEKSFFTSSGYDLAIWPKLLENRYNTRMLRTTWEKIADFKPLDASDKALQAAQSDFATEFCAFTRWNYYTSYRTVLGSSDEMYPEAAKYRSITFQSTVELLNGTASFSNELPPLASNYVRVYKGIDTVTFIIANIDMSHAFKKELARSSYSLEVKQKNFDDGYQKLSNGWGFKFIPQYQNTFCMKAIVGVQQPCDYALDAFPNPFNPAIHNYVTIPLPCSITRSTVQLNIHTVSFDQIYQNDNVKVVREAGVTKIKWDGRTNDGSVIKSGVYIYSVAFGDEMQMGKLAVIHH